MKLIKYNQLKLDRKREKYYGMSTLLAKKYFYVRKVTRARAPTVISPELSKGIYDLNYQMQTVREGPVDDEAKTREILDARNALRKALELASLAPLDR